MIWFRIIRPQTLFASLCPVLVALLAGGMPSPWLAVCTALCALSLQILSNLVNDYYDFVRGADCAGRVGFSRALAEGWVTQRQMLCACLTALGVSVGLGLVLVLSGGWPVLLIGVTALLFAWLYTATDYSLSYLGIADIFVFLYYGVIAAWGTWWIQYAAGGEAPACMAQGWVCFWAGAVCGLVSMCVLIINNLRDIDADRSVGKRTFPVRFGKQAGEVGMAVIVLCMPICAWLAFRAWLPMLVVLPAAALWLVVHRAKGAQYNRCLLSAGLLNVLYVLLVALTV